MYYEYIITQFLLVLLLRGSSHCWVVKRISNDGTLPSAPKLHPLEVSVKMRPK